MANLAAPLFQQYTKTSSQPFRELRMGTDMDIPRVQLSEQIATSTILRIYEYVGRFS